VTTVGQPVCVGCVHLKRVNGRPDWVRLTCTAFPDGIPDAIVNNEADHRETFSGDNGIRFVPVDADAVAYAARTFAIDPNDEGD